MKNISIVVLLFLVLLKMPVSAGTGFRLFLNWGLGSSIYSGKLAEYYSNRPLATAASLECHLNVNRYIVVLSAVHEYVGIGYDLLPDESLESHNKGSYLYPFIGIGNTYIDETPLIENDKWTRRDSLFYGINYVKYLRPSEYPDDFPMRLCFKFEVNQVAFPNGDVGMGYSLYAVFDIFSALCVSLYN